MVNFRNQDIFQEIEVAFVKYSKNSIRMYHPNVFLNTPKLAGKLLNTVLFEAHYPVIKKRIINSNFC